MVFVVAALCGAGCQYDDSRLVYNPTLADLEGHWETVGLLREVPYAAVVFDAQGEGRVVIVGEDTAERFGRVWNFQTKDTYFTANLKFPPPRATVFTIIGRLDKGMLCFQFVEKDEGWPDATERWVFGGCFVRAEELSDFRKRASELL